MLVSCSLGVLTAYIACPLGVLTACVERLLDGQHAAVPEGADVCHYWDCGSVVSVSVPVSSLLRSSAWGTNAQRHLVCEPPLFPSSITDALAPRSLSLLHSGHRRTREACHPGAHVHTHTHTHTHTGLNFCVCVCASACTHTPLRRARAHATCLLQLAHRRSDSGTLIELGTRTPVLTPLWLVGRAHHTTTPASKRRHPAGPRCGGGKPRRLRSRAGPRSPAR